MAEEPPKKRQKFDTEDSAPPGPTSRSQEDVILAAAPEEGQDMIAASTDSAANPTDLPLIRAELEKIRKRKKDMAKERRYSESDHVDAYNLGYPILALGHDIRIDPERAQRALTDVFAEAKTLWKQSGIVPATVHFSITQSEAERELAAKAKAEEEQREAEKRRVQDADVAGFMNHISWTTIVDKLVIDYLDAVDWNEDDFKWRLQEDKDWSAYWTLKVQTTTPTILSASKQSTALDAQILKLFQHLKWDRVHWDIEDSPLLQLRTTPPWI